MLDGWSKADETPSLIGFGHRIVGSHSVKPCLRELPAPAMPIFPVLKYPQVAEILLSDSLFPQPGFLPDLDAAERWNEEAMADEIQHHLPVLQALHEAVDG